MTARNGTGTVVVPLQELLEAMSDGVLITDENGRCSTQTRPLTTWSEARRAILRWVKTHPAGSACRTRATIGVSSPGH